MGAARVLYRKRHAGDTLTSSFRREAVDFAA
jgi:hypothetical protein